MDSLSVVGPLLEQAELNEAAAVALRDPAAMVHYRAEIRDLRARVEAIRAAGLFPPPIDYPGKGSSR